MPLILLVRFIIGKTNRWSSLTGAAFKRCAGMPVRWPAGRS
jgi:hypothetical protein